MKKLVLVLSIMAVMGLSLTPKKAEAVEPMAFFGASFVASIIIGETLLHFGLVDGHIPGDTSAENISSNQASKYWRP